MVNRAVVVVVVLQKFMGLNQHVGHVFVQDDVFLFKFGNQVPHAFVNVKIINQYVVQQFSQLGETNLVHVANVVQQIVKQLLHRGSVFPQLQRFYVGDIREIGFRGTRRYFFIHDGAGSGNRHNFTAVQYVARNEPHVFRDQYVFQPDVVLLGHVHVVVKRLQQFAVNVVKVFANNDSGGFGSRADHVHDLGVHFVPPQFGRAAQQRHVNLKVNVADFYGLDFFVARN